MTELQACRLLFGLAISALVLDVFPSVWYLDHTVAIFLALLLLAFGIKLLVEIFVYKKTPIPGIQLKFDKVMLVRKVLAVLEKSELNR